MSWGSPFWYFKEMIVRVAVILTTCGTLHFRDGRAVVSVWQRGSASNEAMRRLSLTLTD